MQFLNDEQVWLIDAPVGYSFEVIVPGNSSTPCPSRLAQAELVLDNIEAIQKSAISHIEAFVDCSKFAENNKWTMEGVEFGRSLNEPNTQFIIFFSIVGDIYGEWSVLFQTSNNRHYPISFTRRQI